MAAFQALGPFISTFADPAISGIQVMYNADGTVQIASVEDMEVDESARTSTEVHLAQDVPKAEPEVIMESGVTRLETKLEEKEYESVGKLEVSLGKKDPESEFNSFVFWRNPVPVIAVDGNSSEGSDSEGESPQTDAAQDSNTQLTLPTAPEGTTQQGAQPDSEKSSSDVSPDSKPEEKESEITTPGDHGDHSQEAVNGAASQEAQQQTENEDINNLASTISKVGLGDKQEEVVPPEKPERAQQGEDDTENESGKVLKAAVNEANDLTETTEQIGSTQVIGQRLDEKTLTFVNGIVEEEVGEWSGHPSQEGSEDDQSLSQVSAGFRKNRSRL